MIDVKCLHCNKIFKKAPYEIKRTKNRNFCSRDCFNNHQRNDRKNNIKECKSCGKNFTKDR